jgi:hypothetical protein
VDGSTGVQPFWHFTQKHLQNDVLSPMNVTLGHVDVDAAVLLEAGGVEIATVLGAPLCRMLRCFVRPAGPDLSTARMRVIGSGQSAGTDETSTSQWRVMSTSLRVHVASPSVLVSSIMP